MSARKTIQGVHPLLVIASKTSATLSPSKHRAPGQIQQRLERRRVGHQQVIEQNIDDRVLVEQQHGQRSHKRVAVAAKGVEAGRAILRSGGRELKTRIRD